MKQGVQQLAPKNSSQRLQAMPRSPARRHAPPAASAGRGLAALIFPAASKASAGSSSAWARREPRRLRADPPKTLGAREAGNETWFLTPTKETSNWFFSDPSNWSNETWRLIRTIQLAFFPLRKRTNSWVHSISHALLLAEKTFGHPCPKGHAATRGSGTRHFLLHPRDEGAGLLRGAFECIA